jgi:uncharacterized protein (DUF305 family)
MPRLHPARLQVRLGWPHFILAVALGGLLLSAGWSWDAASPCSSGRPAAAIDQWNPADMAFMQAMLLHRKQALQITSLVQGRTARPELLRLARRIQLAQDGEVAQTAALLRDHRTPVSSSGVGHASGEGEGEHEGERGYAGMMARTQMRTLAATTGERFDFLFVDMMLEHHNGAVVMAREVLADGRDPQVGQFASSVIADHQRKFRELTTLRRRWAAPFLRQLV